MGHPVFRKVSKGNESMGRKIKECEVEEEMGKGKRGSLTNASLVGMNSTAISLLSM